MRKPLQKGGPPWFVTAGILPEGAAGGDHDIPDVVDTLERMNRGILFASGGDGTLRAAGKVGPGEILSWNRRLPNE